MSMSRHSKQRDAVKAFLMSTNMHPTADNVYEALQADFPNISLGTVYRNLNFLVEHGEAIRLDCGDGVIHFDGTTEAHNHFFCRGCHRIFDLKMDGIDHINIIANAGFDGKIEEHILYFSGLCKDCLQTETDSF